VRWRRVGRDILWHFPDMAPRSALGGVADLQAGAPKVFVRHGPDPFGWVSRNVQSFRKRKGSFRDRAHGKLPLAWAGCCEFIPPRPDRSGLAGLCHEQKLARCLRSAAFSCENLSVAATRPPWHKSSEVPDPLGILSRNVRPARTHIVRRHAPPDRRGWLGVTLVSRQAPMTHLCPS
jgi:hypothetical protein